MVTPGSQCRDIVCIRAELRTHALPHALSRTHCRTHAGAMIFYGGQYLAGSAEKGLDSYGIRFDSPYDSLKFGAMISATDPVATLSVRAVQCSAVRCSAVRCGAVRCAPPG